MGKDYSPEYSKTPKYMPCIKEEYNNEGTKPFLNYFSDLRFKQPDDNSQVYMLLLNTFCFIHNGFSTNKEINNVIKEAN